jgi:hypothetical protein
MEARDEKRLLRLRSQLAAHKPLIVDEPGYVPLSPTGAELLLEVFSQRHERGSIIVTSNLPFEEWTSVFGSERLTGAPLDRLTHHVHILELNGDSYRLKQSKNRRRKGRDPADDEPPRAEDVDPDTGDASSWKPPKAKSPLREGGFLLQSASIATGRLLLRRPGRKSLRR